MQLCERGRRRRPAALLLPLLLLLLGLLACAVVIEAAPPASLTNFQDEYACPSSILIVRPTTVQDVQAAVATHAHVQAIGAGHSWHEEFFCAAVSPAPQPALPESSHGLLQQPAGSAPNGSTTATSANIAMMTLRPLNISLNETERSVWVDAGVITADLLAYLSNAVSPRAPAGWTLGSFPWFVYQTIGGAVSTGTHGSNLGPHKSLSNQVLALDVVLANGTRQVFSADSHPFLMRALRVSVGRLGIIVRVKLAIVPEVPVRRTLSVLSVPQFLQVLDEAQRTWVDTGAAAAWMNETQVFFLPQQQQFMVVSFTRADEFPANASSQLQEVLAGFVPDSTTVFERKGDVLSLGELVLPADAQLHVSASQVLVSAPGQGAAGGSHQQTQLGSPYAAAQAHLDGLLARVINHPVAGAAAADAQTSEAQRSAGVPWKLPPHKAPSAFYATEAETLMNVSRLGIQTVAGNASAEAAQMYIRQPALTLPNLQNTLYDQIEVSIPLAAMGTCWRRLADVMYDGDLEGANATQRARDKGFRTAALIRFVGAEDGLLSQTGDGARMFINIEDYVFFNSNRTINLAFKRVMAVLTGDPACTSKGPPRLHWGKAGFPDRGCWHGDVMYGENWCSFGCALRALDPTGKFLDSAPAIWTWAGMDLDACCGPDGFTSKAPGCQCKVQHARAMSDCPPAPFYTSR